MEIGVQRASGYSYQRSILTFGRGRAASGL